MKESVRVSATERFPSPLTALRILLPFSIGYFFSFFLRSINAVISPDLVRDIGASAADLGLITSAFFFSFALFQIPLGLLLDRFDPKKVGGTLLLFGVAGTLVFAWGRTVPALVAGRALIGIGFSGALMSPFVANVLWFPKDRVVLANSVILAGGGLGGLASTVPIEYFLRFSDWRTIFVLTSGLIALASAMILLFVPARAPEKSGETVREQWRGYLEILKSPVFWKYALVYALSAGSFLSLQGLWAAPWFRDVAGFERPEVALHLLVISLFMVPGYFAMGIIFSLLKAPGIGQRVIVGMSYILFEAVQLLILFEVVSRSYLIWALFGFLGTSSAPVYAILTGLFPRRLAGRVNTMLNMFLLFATFGIQYAMGILIDLWPLTATGGYQPQAYQAAFGFALALQFAALVWFLRPGGREKG